jgi:hypothetical protein
MILAPFIPILYDSAQFDPHNLRVKGVCLSCLESLYQVALLISALVGYNPSRLVFSASDSINFMIKAIEMLAFQDALLL